MSRTIVMTPILVLVAVAGTAIFYTGEELALRRRIPTGPVPSRPSPFTM